MLLPILNDIKDDISCVKREISRLNETMTKLNQTLSQQNDTLGILYHNLILVKMDLTDISNTTNSICDKVEDHNNNMTNKLIEINEQMKWNFSVQLKSTYGYIISPPVYTCGDTGGWRHAVHLDMTDPSTDCPDGWNMTDYSKRTCGRASDGVATCDSVAFPVSGGEYSQVCGSIKAYSWGTPTAFAGYTRVEQDTLDAGYFTGVAVMHGNPRQHIWTFVAGAAENFSTEHIALCPCDISYSASIPPFIGDDYFCESGFTWPGYWNESLLRTLHSDDPLWDGNGCHSSSTCCSLNNPPYFTTILNTTTMDDIELRLCVLESRTNIAIEFIDLYVK